MSFTFYNLFNRNNRSNKWLISDLVRVSAHVLCVCVVTDEVRADRIFVEHAWQPVRQAHKTSENPPADPRPTPPPPVDVKSERWIIVILIDGDWRGGGGAAETKYRLEGRNKNGSVTVTEREERKTAGWMWKMERWWNIDNYIWLSERELVCVRAPLTDSRLISCSGNNETGRPVRHTHTKHKHKILKCGSGWGFLINRWVGHP